MTGEQKTELCVLLVEDDRENLDLLLESLPSEIDEHALHWEGCADFDEALRRVEVRRYDLVVTDIYRDREDRQKGINPDDDRARDIVARIRDARFCPVVAFTDGSFPASLQEGPFVKLADKSKGDDQVIEKLKELLDTGIPGIARKLHDELDRAGGSYLWNFLEGDWERLRKNGLAEPLVLERLIRRRAAMQIGRLDPVAQDPSEVDSVEAVEYYIHPPVSEELRLGEILKHKEGDAFRVVLTPHCHLAVQDGAEGPRAEFVLTVKTVRPTDIPDAFPPPGRTEAKKLRNLARYAQSPAELGKPRGRYWFLPCFLDMPDLFCDFLQLESIPYQEINADYSRFAVLDTPFAEALQSCFARFYSAVGLPGLTEGFRRRWLQRVSPPAEDDPQQTG